MRRKFVLKDGKMQMVFPIYKDKIADSSSWIGLSEASSEQRFVAKYVALQLN